MRLERSRPGGGLSEQCLCLVTAESIPGGGPPRPAATLGPEIMVEWESVIISVISLVVLLKPASASSFKLESFKLSGNTGYCDDFSSQAPCSIPINANITLSDNGQFSDMSI